MKLLDRYLLAQFLAPFVVCLITFVMIFVIVDLFQNLSVFIEVRTPLPQILRYYVYLLPSQLVFIVPIALFLALQYSLWQLAKRNELTAMRASGVSLFRISIPLLLVGLAASLAVGLLFETVEPGSSYWANRFVSRMEKPGAVSARYVSPLLFKNELQNRLWEVRRFDLETFRMDESVKIVQQRPNKSDAMELRADEARYYDGCWWLFNVTLRRYDFANNPVGPVEYQSRMEMREWTETPEDFINEHKLLRDQNKTMGESISFRDLMAYRQRHPDLSGETLVRILVDMHSRLAMPWTSFIVVLFGIPFGLRTARQGALMGFVAAILTLFSFYLVLNYCQWLGKKQYLLPWVSAWLPVYVFFWAGIFLVNRTR